MSAAGDPLTAVAQEQHSRATLRIAILPDFLPAWEPWLKMISDGLREFGHTEFGKLVQLVHEAKPSVKRVGVLMTYVPPLHVRAETDLIIGGMQAAASRLGLDLRVFEISKAEELDAVLASVASQGVEALVLTSGVSIQARRKEIIQFAAARRLT